MAVPLRLPTPLADRRSKVPLIHAVEAVALAAGAGALAFLSSDRTILIIIGVMFVVVAAFALVLSRPSVVVEVAVITMWFDSVGAGPVRTGRVVSGLAIFVLFARLAASDWKPPALLARAWVLPATFFMWSFVSGFWAAEMGSWIQGLLELTLGFIYALIIMLYIENEEHLARAFKAFVWTGVPIAIISYVLFNKIEEVQQDIGGENRIVGFTGNANAYATLLAVAVPIAVIFLRRATSKFERFMYGAVIFGYMVALVTTGSRGGLITMGVMVVYLFVTWPGLTPRDRVKSSFGGIAFVATGVVLAAIMNPERYSLLGFFGDAGAGRLDLWNAATKSFGVRPIQGFSIGGFRTQMLDVLTKVPGGTLEITKPINNRNAAGLEVHNTYLTILLDLGVIGLVIYVATMLGVFKNLWDLRRTQWRDWAWASFGANGALLVGAVFGSGYNLKFQWTIVGIAGAGFVRTRSTARGDRVRSHRGLPALRDSIRPSVPGASPVFGERAFAAPMDLRLRYPFRWMMALAIFGGGFVGFAGAKAFGTPEYTAYQQVLVVNMDTVDPRFGLQISDSRIQFVLNIALSDRYLAEVQRRSGVDETLDELATQIDATRAGFSNIIRITVKTDNEQATQRIGAVLVDSLDSIVDSARTGSLAVTDEDGRAVSPDIDPDYRGPLYLHLFDDPIATATTPRALYCGFLGAGLAGLGLVIVAMLLHERRRLTSVEDISELLEVPFVASMPRARGVKPAQAALLYSAVGDQIDDACADPPRVVALFGNDIESVQAQAALGVAGGLGQVQDVPIVLVDLDVTKRALSRRLGLGRRRGIIDVAVGRASLDEVRVPVPRRRLPKSVRRLVGRGAELQRYTVVPVGGRDVLRDRSAVLDEAAISAAVSSLAASSLVVVNLPAVPGPLPVREILLLCDAVLLTVLDGWSETDQALTSIDAVDAVVPRRVGYVLVDQ